MTIPDGMPTLKGGSHPDVRNGACVMEYIALLCGEPHTTLPSAVHPALVSWGWAINDLCPDDDLRAELLMPMVPRLMLTHRIPLECGPAITARMETAWRAASWRFDEASRQVRYLAAELVAVLDESDAKPDHNISDTSPALDPLESRSWDLCRAPHALTAADLQVLDGLDAEFDGQLLPVSPAPDVSFGDLAERIAYLRRVVRVASGAASASQPPDPFGGCIPVRR